MKALKITTIRISACLTFVILLFILSNCTSNNSSSSAEKAEDKAPTESLNEWVTLFDGTTYTGWKMYNHDEISDAWLIEDGALVASKAGVGENVGFGHSLITADKYDNFEFEMEYKLTKGGNSGIMYHVIEDTAYNHDYETGPEFQFLDDEFSTSESLPNRLSGSSYDMYTPSADKKLNGADQWNKVKLVYNKGHVEHWLNDIKVVGFEEGSADWQARYDASKWASSPSWGKSTVGHIGLQNHGDAVWFKNIRIRKL